MNGFFAKLEADKSGVLALLVENEYHAARHKAIDTRRRPLELLVAEIGDELLPLGDVASVDAVAGRLGLQLDTQAEVADFHWTPGVTTDADMHSHAESAVHLARRIAVGHAAAGAFPAEVTMLHQRTLVLHHLRVAFDGHVEELSRVELMDQVSVPYTMP